MRWWIMDLGQRYLAPSVAGVFLAMGLAGCITSQGEMDRQMSRAIGRSLARAKLQAALDNGWQLRQAGKADGARELYEATCRRLVVELGPQSDAANVLTGAMTAARANSDGRKAMKMLESALADAIAAEEFDTVVSGRIVEGFPEPSPIGAIRVKHYPAARAAGADFDGNRDKTFSALFAHLQTRKLEMASPVMQTYTSGPEEQSLGSLCRIAFFYEKPNMGAVGNDGTVLVADVPAVTVVSVAVQGEYTADRFAPALKVLRSWLADHTDRYAAAGEPRVLAYNSPLVPGFMRYAEVQIPIRTK